MSPIESPVRESSPAPTPSALPTGQVTTRQRDTRQPGGEKITHYDLRVELLAADKMLRVEETIRYANRTGETLAEVVLLLPSSRDPLRFKPGRLDVDGSPQGARLDGVRLVVPLVDSLEPESVVEIEIMFELDLPRLGFFAGGSEGSLGWTERQFVLADWMLIVAPYRADGGWRVNPPHIVGEHAAVEIAHYEVEILIDSPEYEVLAPGRGNYADGRGRFEHGPARGFAWAAVRDMETERLRVGNVRVESHFFPEHRPAGEAALETAAEAVESFGRMFGGYPHERLVVVEGDFLDGLEADGLVFVGRDYYAVYPGSDASLLTAITAHEVAHQWWYGLVGNDPALEPWLDEALATYSEALYYEDHHPELTEWWWGFRIEPYAPRGQLGSPIYAFNAFRPYVNAVYLRGAQFLAALRAEMGDEAFLEFLQRYVSGNRGRLATEADFWEAAGISEPLQEALLAEYFRPGG